MDRRIEKRIGWLEQQHPGRDSADPFDYSEAQLAQIVADTTGIPAEGLTEEVLARVAAGDYELKA